MVEHKEIIWGKANVFIILSIVDANNINEIFLVIT